MKRVEGKAFKLLCCSDTHGDPPPALDNEDEAVAWLHAGDFYNRLEGRPMKERERNRFGLLSEWLAARKINVFGVHGNHDCSDPCGFSNRYVDGEIVKIMPGWWVVGVGWHGDRFFELPLERDITEACKSVADRAVEMMKAGEIADGDRSILLTHYPPYYPEHYQYDGNPEGWMFRSVKALVEGLSPNAVVQGHVHELFGQQFRLDDGTLVVNPGPRGGVLRLDEWGVAEFEWQK
jgi:Icc-related predicted phosphoesterase